MTTHRRLLFAGLSAFWLMSADWAYAETALDPPFITITVDEPVGTPMITNNRSVTPGTGDLVVLAATRDGKDPILAAEDLGALRVWIPLKHSGLSSRL